MKNTLLAIGLLFLFQGLSKGGGFLYSPVQGTTTNDDACTGCIGEFKSSTTANVDVTASATWYDAAAIVLTPGDWDVWGKGFWRPNGATFTNTDFRLGISTTPGNSTIGLTNGDNLLQVTDVATSTWNTMAMGLDPIRASLSSSTTYYLKAVLATFVSGTPKSWGSIKARRAR